MSHQRFTAENRRQQILEIATELFANRGYEGTTTREISNGAKVNEAIIFRHFPSKEELYWAVIENKCQTNPGRAKVRDRLAQGGPIRDVLLDIVEGILQRRQQDQTLTRLLFFSALEKHSLSERFFETYISSYYETLADFIRERMDSGELRRGDALLSARGFFGMVIYHSLVQDLFGAKRYKEYDLREVSENIVSIWLDGMSPAEEFKLAQGSKHQKGKQSL